MRTHTPATPLAAALMVLALGVFHSARPVAVSAQSKATLAASATVVVADAAWTAQELTEAVIRAATADGDVAGLTSDGRFPTVDGGVAAAPTLSLEAFRAERDATVVWLQPAPEGSDRALVTVAHLGS